MHFFYPPWEIPQENPPVPYNPKHLKKFEQNIFSQQVCILKSRCILQFHELHQPVTNLSIFNHVYLILENSVTVLLQKSFTLVDHIVRKMVDQECGRTEPRP